MKRAPHLPVFAQTLGLVLATLVIAQIAAIVVILSLPPPPPEIYTVADVARAIRAQGLSASEPEGGREARVLTVRRADAPPARLTQGARRLVFRDALAANLGIDPARIIISQSRARLLTFPPILGPARHRAIVAAQNAAEQPLLFGGFRLGIHSPSGAWLIVQPKMTFGIDPWRQRLLLVLALSVVAVSPLAWAFSRRLAAPIKALAAGAERLGRDPGAPPLDITGPAEVGAAVAAFNNMQARLTRYVELRTTMMGAIAHDLRTPLTRLRFRIEAVAEPLRGKLAADIDSMEAMVAATLGFVRDVAQPSDRRKIDLTSLLETVIDEAALTGCNASLDNLDRVVVEGDSIALKRLITNLVDNALKFGSRAHGRVLSQDGMGIIEIDDDGPGVPEADIERAFEPFHRLESSRSRETGGIGLGLAVVAAVARSHGGEATLINLPGGGLRARVLLPLPAVAPADTIPRGSPSTFMEVGLP